MSKRSAASTETSELADGQSFSKARASGKDGLKSAKRPSLPPDTREEMGEFEDEWEDEIESDDEVVNKAAEGMEGSSRSRFSPLVSFAAFLPLGHFLFPDLDLEDDVLPAVEEEDEPEPEPEVFIPGSHKLGEDEILEPDQTVYEMLHRMNVAWPCLSFDVLHDNLGEGRQAYPATAYIVSGTQADVASKNEVLVMKMSQLHKTQKDDADSDDSDDEDDSNSLDEDAILEYRSIPTTSPINRIRAQPLPSTSPLPPISQPYLTASMAESGKVHIWDIRPLIESLDVPGYTIDRNRTNTPVYTVNAHGRAEGFALDWSPPSTSTSGPASQMKLLTGDTHSKIYLTLSSQSSFTTQPSAFSSHTSSIEDLQWSPSEASVFASCSADRSIRIWDTRVKGRRCVVGVDGAHESDVNVISWNRNAGATWLLASGGDEGGLKVWDLRNFKGGKSKPDPVASFAWHRAPITSIEWHPTEESIFVASGADEQVTLWDLSVEGDDDESGQQMQVDGGVGSVPPQLLFVHQGQKDVKEVHWHPLIPGAVVSTAEDGFNIFKTISV